MPEHDSHLRLSGYPEGWYAVAFSADLRPGTVLRRRLMNRELVVFRTASGTAVVMDAYCPHLGAHLAEGGRVCGEEIQCPFHGFRFDAQGHCTSTPYGQRAPNAAIGTWRVEEKFGTVLCFHTDPSIRSGFGDWQVREVAPEHARMNWSAPVGKTFRLRTHPQEIIENTVDIGHFAMVHGYLGCEIHEGMQTDGPHLSMQYIATRGSGLFGKYDPNKLRMHLNINASGVGFSRAQVHDLTLGLDFRFVVMPTPVDDEHVDVHVIAQVAEPQGAFWNGLKLLLTKRLLMRALTRIASSEMARDFLPDRRIWENKRYQPKPKLAQGDGPIMAYRQWAARFMPVDGATGAP